MSPAESLRAIISENKIAPIRATDVPEELQIDMNGLRCLSFEMKERIGRNTAARNASARSAATTTTG